MHDAAPRGAGGTAGLAPGTGSPSRPGRGRLSRSGDFDRVFRQGRSYGARELVLYVFPRGEGDAPRLGLSVSRKVGGAVERNRVKRVLREAFAHEGTRLPPDTDAVIVARHGAKALAQGEGLSAVRRVLRELVSRAVGRENGGGAVAASEAPGASGSSVEPMATEAVPEVLAGQELQL